MFVCSVTQLFPTLATLWTLAYQAPLSMEFSRQEYWSVLPFHPLEDLPDPGIEPKSLVSPVLARRFFTIESLRKTLCGTERLNFTAIFYYL